MAIGSMPHGFFYPVVRRFTLETISSSFSSANITASTPTMTRQLPIKFASLVWDRVQKLKIGPSEKSSKKKKIVTVKPSDVVSSGSSVESSTTVTTTAASFSAVSSTSSSSLSLIENELADFYDVDAAFSMVAGEFDD